MDAKTNARHIEFVLDTYALTHVQRTRLLYDVLRTYTSQSNFKSIDTVCVNIIPCLVTLIKHDRNGLFLVQKEFKSVLMVTDMNFYDVGPDERGRAIERLLLFRKDIPPSTQMPLLWDICIGLDRTKMKETVTTLERMCLLCINPYLIHEIALLPDPITRIKNEHEYKHNPLHPPPPRQPPQPQRGPSSDEIFRRFDANHDGLISQIEAIKALRIYKDDAQRIGFQPGTFAQEDEERRMFNLTFQKIDTNSDKSISPAELRVQFDNFRPR
jgi:hypothetical protein